MDYARHQRDPTRHLIGIAFVVLVHALVIWALYTGLGTKAIEVLKKPLNATIIEEIKLPPPPPPPPPKRPIEQPKVQQPVETYVPPPDIPPPVQSTAPTITAVTPTVPTEPHVIAPPPPPVVATPAPPPPKPFVRKGVACNQVEKPTFPREAIRAGVQKGRVEARLSIDEKGNVTAIDITSSEPPRVFDKVVRAALETWKCEADGSKYVGIVEVNFTLKDE